MLRRSILFLSVLAVLALTAGPVLAVQYTITDLGTLGGSNYTGAYDINNSGQVTGVSSDSGNNACAFLWDGGVMTNLNPVSSPIVSQGYGINNAGTVVGHVAYQAAISTGGGTMSYLLSGSTTSTAYAISNNNNIVVGKDNFSGGIDQAFHYDIATSSLTNLGAMGGYYMSEAKAVNTSGEVVGDGYVMGVGYVPFLYNGTSMTDLTTVITGTQQVFGINDSGWIVGKGSSSNFASGGYLYNGTTSVDLGLVTGSDGTRPQDINNNGLVVGYSTFDRDPDQAMLYDGTSVSLLYDLLDAADQTAWISLEKATAVNDAGQIVGCGITSGGAYRAFLMTPVPEPSTLALAAMGLVGLLCYAWRKRK